jgi:RHS repeat-associated protein
MFRITLLRIAVFTLFCVSYFGINPSMAQNGSQIQKYIVIDLGEIPDATYVEANKINENGQVLGTVYTNGSARAFIWQTNAAMTVLSTDFSMPQLFNNRGKAVLRKANNEWDFWDGTALNPLQLTGVSRSGIHPIGINDAEVSGFLGAFNDGSFQANLTGFRWNGSFTLLFQYITNPTLGYGEGYGINSAGVVAGAGTSYDGRYFGSSFVATQPQGNFGTPAYINDNGVMVGLGSGSTVKMWKNGALFSLGVISGAASSLDDETIYLNEKGSVAGNTPENRGYFWNGSLQDIGTLGGNGDTKVCGLNDLDLLVGSSYKGDDWRATIWDRKKGLQDLNDLINTNSGASGYGWVLYQANDINNKGQIVGVGCYTNGILRAFLLTPGTEDDGCKSCQVCITGPGKYKNNSIEAEWPLGNDEKGYSAGKLLINQASVSTNLSTPVLLQVEPKGSTEVIRSSEGAVRQVKTANGLVDVVTNNAYRYELRFYHLADVGSFSTNVYLVSGSPHHKTIVENPNASTNYTVIKFMDISGSTTNANQFTSTNDNVVELSLGNDLRRELRSSTASITNRLETLTIQNSSGGTVSKEQTQFHLYDWGEVQVTNVVDPDTKALTTAWSYYTNSASTGSYSRVQTTVKPTGAWEGYEYDSTGRETKRVISFLDTTAGSAESNNLVITTSYATNNPAITVVESLKGQEISRKYIAYLPNEVRDIQAYTNGAAWDHANNLVTITKYTTNASFLGKPASIKNPDGTMSFYSYSLSGSNVTTTIQSGQPGAGETNIINGTEQVLVETFGQLVTDTTTSIPSTSYPLSTATVIDTDDFSRPEKIVYNDNTTNTTVYSCCGISSTTDREGITTTYGALDGLGRVTSSTRAGITTLTTFDAESRASQVTRQGSDATSIDIEKSVYNVAGQLTVTTNAANQKVEFNETINSGHTEKTTTFPNGKTKIETYYRDGSLMSISGTGVHAMSYDYGVDSDGVYTKEVYGSSLSGPEWTKTYKDFLGRHYKTVKSSGATTTSTYNSKGQLEKQVDPDGVYTLYEYNGKGELERTYISSDATPDAGGNDRVTQTARSIVDAYGTTVQRTTTSVWGTPNSDTSNVVSIVDVSVNGRQAWSINFGLTNTSYTTYHANGVKTIAVTNANGSTETTVFSNGLITGVTNKTSSGSIISSQTTTYDPHNRPSAVTDARGMASAMYYNNLDQVVTNTLTGSGGLSQTTIHTYNSMAQRSGSTLPDSGAITYEYTDYGELKKQYGTRTYPVEYSYTGEGRLSTIKTWQNYSGLSGTATTTLGYSTNSGLLISKTYNDSTATEYAYTSAGRLQTRTWDRGTSATYSYSLGDLSGINYSDSTPDVTYGYDRRGRRTGITNSTEVINYTFHDSGLPLVENHSGGPLTGVAVTNSYNALLLRSALTASKSGSSYISETFGFDSASRLSAVTNGSYSVAYGFTTNSLVSTLTFKQSSTTRLATTNSFDGLARRTVVSSAPSADSVRSFTYAYNTANQRTTSTLADGSFWDFAYNSAGEVTNAVKKLAGGTPINGEQFGFSFDSIGNRSSSTVNGQTAAYTANLLNQYTNRTVPSVLDVLGTAATNATVTVANQSTLRQGEYFFKQRIVTNSSTALYVSNWTVAVKNNVGTNDTLTIETGHMFVPKTPEAMTYDTDGNLLSDGHWNYTWDAENRLTTMEALTNLVTAVRKKLDFTYDAQGRRIQKLVSSGWNGSAYTVTSTNKCIYDGWNKIVDLNGTNGVVQTYTWGPDLSGSMQGAGGVGGLLAVATTNATHFVINDGNGNVAALVNAADGTLSANYEYGPFGELARSSGTMADTNPFRFSTKYQDDESGFLYYGYRYYNPTLGKWLGREPLGEGESPNLYNFVRNNAVNSFDRLGLEWIQAIYHGEDYYHKYTISRPRTIVRPTDKIGALEVYHGASALPKIVKVTPPEYVVDKNGKACVKKDTGIYKMQWEYWGLRAGVPPVPMQYQGQGYLVGLADILTVTQQAAEDGTWHEKTEMLLLEKLFKHTVEKAEKRAREYCCDENKPSDKTLEELKKYIRWDESVAAYDKQAGADSAFDDKFGSVFTEGGLQLKNPKSMYNEKDFDPWYAPPGF